jgi:hypothetical protein
MTAPWDPIDPDKDNPETLRSNQPDRINLIGPPYTRARKKELRRQYLLAKAEYKRNFDLAATPTEVDRRGSPPAYGSPSSSSGLSLIFVASLFLVAALACLFIQSRVFLAPIFAIIALLFGLIGLRPFILHFAR